MYENSNASSAAGQLSSGGKYAGDIANNQRPIGTGNLNASGTSASQTLVDNFINEIALSLDSIAQANNRFGSFGDRVLGAQPTPSTDSKTDSPYCKADALRTIARFAQSLSSQLHQNASRLEEIA